MNECAQFDAWLNCLMHLLPPDGVVHVGAGSELSNSYARMPRLFVVESDLDNCLCLQKQLVNHPDCQVIQAVLAGHTGEAEFYNLSQSNESGLCQTDQLQRLWPNIKTLYSTTKPVITLKDLLEQTASSLLPPFNWVVIDCLPAGELLKGAGTLPAHWDVLVIRLLKDIPVLEDEWALGVASMQQQLLGFGLELVMMEDENHPQIVRALFVRKPTQRKAIANEQALLEVDIAMLTKANAEFAALANANSNEKIQAFAYCETLAKKLSEAYILRFQASQENAMLKARNDELVVAMQRLESKALSENIVDFNIRE